ncbi:MAG: hypothetical protein ACREDR_15750, partial [Blastocatellia bacterium]
LLADHFLDGTRTRRSGYQALDREITRIESRVRAEAPELDNAHLRDFVDLLNAVANFAAASLQQGLFTDKRAVDEKKFQKVLLLHMRGRLGEGVVESPREGGGVPDIVYRSVTCELKVERRVTERQRIIDKYIQQATQYTSAHGGRLGVLCVLDVTKKKSPPAAPVNQLFLERPALHGFLELPPRDWIYLAVVVIDGRIQHPSIYSRKIG